AVTGGGTTTVGGSSSGTSGSGQQGGQGSTGTSGTGSSGGNGPGVTASTIYIGAGYEPDTQAADSAIGAANAGPGDEKAETQAIIDYINAHGGVAHRKLAPVWYAVRVSNSNQTT